MREVEQIAALFDRLIAQPLREFPQSGQEADAPDRPGVYVILSPTEEPEHVGETITLLKRMHGHMRGASSYVEKSLSRDGAQLRNGYKFRYLEIDNPRQRMLLQAMTIAKLCPRHLGDRSPQSN